MKIITACDNNFENYYLNLKKSCEKLGYKIVKYNINSDLIVENKEIKKAKPCLFKIDIIEKALLEYKESILWIDSDCLVIDNIDEINNDWDIGITVRNDGNKNNKYYYFSGYLNAGVVFFNYNDNSFDIINLWKQTVEETITKGDQEALTLLFINNKKYNIKSFPCKIYNYFYFPEEPIGAKVLHFKGDKREYYERYLEEYEI